MYIDDVNVLVRGPNAQANCRTLEAVYPKLRDWADRHASVFAPEKFKLMHFSKPTRRNKKDGANDMSARANIEGTTLEPQDSARLLGIALDSQLSWKPHLQNIEANATSKIAAIRSLGNSAWGLEMQAVRKLYRAVVVPSVLYCCSAWYTPGATDYKGTQNKILKVLNGIQKRAAIGISGAYKRVAYDSLNILCHLQPIEYTLEQHAAAALLRLKSSPNFSIMETLRQDIRSPRTQRQMDDYRSPLEIHEQRLERVWGPHNLERRQPYAQAPWQKPVPTSIAPNDNEAVEEHGRKARHSLCVYTDGSGLDGQVGAAMVLPQLNIERGNYMGPENNSHSIHSGTRGPCFGPGRDKTPQRPAEGYDFHRQPSSHSGNKPPNLPLRTRHCQGHSRPDQDPPESWIPNRDLLDSGAHWCAWK